MAKRKKKKKSQRLNETSNESIASQTVSEDDDSSQEEESSNSTIKRKPDTISPPENQPKSKIANCATTPKTISNEPNTSSNDSSDTSSNTTESSDTSKDSHGLQIDESKLNSRIDTDDNSEGDDANVTEKLLYVSGSDHQRADNSHMQISHDEENMAQTEKIIPFSYSLHLPTVKQLMAQRFVPKPSSEQSRDEQRESAGKFAKVVMRSPGIKDHTLEKENQYKEGAKGRTIYGSYYGESDVLPYMSPEELLKAIIKHIDKNHIQAFYKSAGDKFVIVLNSAKLKETYSSGVHFSEQVQNLIKL